ncbi:hypothetical protein [Streptomyces sp. NWU339]|uniref:hypothetical protein n=1 Tax=Streptomyces sp. NWU339 TaxID=2185284 RepID=UPI00215A7D39|nr:hypothetical protein [Streptomyces sp. NWU339]
MIHVRPAVERRRDFARWATGHTPKLRTVSPDTFAVPPRLFTDAPENLLIGAIVDGHRYRSPLEDEANNAPPPGAVHLTGPVLVGETGPETVVPLVAERTAVPGDVLPPAPESAYGPDSVPLPEPEPELAGTAGDVAPSEGEGAPFACDGCPRTFTTARGRDTHRRQAHAED